MLSLGHDAAGHEELSRLRRVLLKAQKEAEHQEWVRQRKEAEIRQARGDLVYKLVVPHPTKEGAFSTPWLFKTIRLGKLTKADGGINIYAGCMPGGRYPSGSHVFPTRAAARAYKNRRHRILQGRLVGTVLAYGGQSPVHKPAVTQPVLVVTAVRWERVVR